MNAIVGLLVAGETVALVCGEEDRGELRSWHVATRTGRCAMCPHEGETLGDGGVAELGIGEANLVVTGQAGRWKSAAAMDAFVGGFVAGEAVVLIGREEQGFEIGTRNVATRAVCRGMRAYKGEALGYGSMVEDRVGKRILVVAG